MLFRREFPVTVSGTRGSSGFYSHLINTSPGHGAGNQRANGQLQEQRSNRRKHTWHPARSIVFQSPAADITWRIPRRGQASAGSYIAAEDPQNSIGLVYQVAHRKGQMPSAIEANAKMPGEDQGRTPLKRVRIRTGYATNLGKERNAHARRGTDFEFESGLETTEPLRSSHIERSLDMLSLDIHGTKERDQSVEDMISQCVERSDDVDLPISKAASAPGPLSSSQGRTADASNPIHEKDARQMPSLKSRVVRNNIRLARKAEQQASRVINDTALLAFPDTIDSGPSSKGNLDPRRGPSFKSSPALSAQQCLYPGDFFAARLRLVGNLQHLRSYSGGVSGFADRRLRRVESGTLIIANLLLPIKTKPVQSFFDSPGPSLIGRDLTRSQPRRVISGPGLGTITSTANEESKRLPPDSIPVTGKKSRKSLKLLFHGRDEQKNQELSVRAQQSLHKLLNALCDAANETVSHSRRTILQLCELEVRSSGEMLRNTAYYARVSTRWREEWHSPEDRHGYPDVSQRLRVLRQICEKHKREAEMTCKSSWLPVFYEYQSLQRYWTLYGLKSEKEKNELYHRLVAPLTRSLGEIQMETSFTVSQGKGKVSDIIKEVFLTRTAIIHHMQQLLGGWILLPSGRWYRKFELTDDNLRQSMSHFRHSMVQLGTSLEWLYRKEWGLYRRPTKKEEDIRTMVDTYARLHRPVVPQLQPDESPMYLPAQGDRGEGSNAIERLRQPSWPKSPFSQSSVPMKAFQHPVNVARPKAATVHTSSAATSVVDVVAEHSRPQRYPMRRPLRRSTEGYPVKMWPDYCRMRTLSFLALSSLGRLVDTLREPIGHDVDASWSNRLLLYALEFHHTEESLNKASYRARKYVRLREEWDSTRHGSNAGNHSLHLEVLERLRRGEERLASISFCSSLKFVYDGYLEVEQCRRLYGLCSLAEQRRLYRQLVEPVSRTGNELRLLIFQGSTRQDKAVYPLKRFVWSFTPVIKLSQTLVDGWLQPWGHYRTESLVSKDTMAIHIKQLRQSFIELELVLGPLRNELKKASQSSNRSIHGSPPGQYMLDPEWENPCQTPAPQNSPPIYLPEEGKERKRKRDRLKQTPWPETSPLRSSTPLLNSRNVVRTLDQKAASFHTSATTRHPAASPAPNVESEGSQEEESMQVNRGNETLEALVCSPRGYHIPSATQRECMLASTATRSAYWQYTLYEGPKGERVKVHYCKSLENTERISKLFLNEKVIGFDIEWKPLASAKDGIRKNVAMIQLASEERIALFHLARFSKGEKIEDLLAPTFKQIMESDAITKVGVSIKADCTRLRNYMNVDSRGLFELSHLYKLVKYADKDVKKINKKLVSLATQTEEHLKLPMYKGQSVRSSDWSEVLNYEQIYYAASDTYAGFQLYHILNHKRQSMFPTPPLPAHANLNLPIRLANGQTVAEYEEPDAEEPPPEPSDDALSPVGQLVEGIMNLQIEDGPPPPATPRTNPKQKAASLSSHPSIVAANEWIARYLASSAPPVISSNDLSYPLLPPSSSSSLSPSPSPSPSPLPSSATSAPSTPTPTSKPRPTPAPLRAYFLFYHHRLSIPDIASLLRDPPLQHATVAGYVLDTVRFPNLTLDKARAEECLEFVGEAGRGRYRGLVRRLEERDMI